MQGIPLHGVRGLLLQRPLGFKRGADLSRIIQEEAVSCSREHTRGALRGCNAACRACGTLCSRRWPLWGWPHPLPPRLPHGSCEARPCSTCCTPRPRAYQVCARLLLLIDISYDTEATLCKASQRDCIIFMLTPHLVPRATMLLSDNMNFW